MTPAPINPYPLLQACQRQRVSDGAIAPILTGTDIADRLLVLIWPQLGDFDSLEYAQWLQRQQAELQAAGITVRAIGIGDRDSGQRFCEFTGFPAEQLFIDPTASLHQELQLYPGLQLTIPGLPPAAKAWLNLLLMCAGIGSPGTLAEVFRGYRGDRSAPQLIGAEESVQAFPLPPIKGNFFNLAGGSGFQRPMELATLRLRNMAESLGHWRTYVPDASHMTQRGGTFLFDRDRQLIYEHRDRGILGFSATMNRPLSFLAALPTESATPVT